MGWIVALLLAACEPAAPPPPPRSTPVAGQEAPKASVTATRVDPQEITLIADPVQELELSSRFPVVAALSPAARDELVGAVNLIEGPCPPCVGRSLARCAVDAPTGCENLPGLMERAARLAGEGALQEKVRLSVAYGGPWHLLPETRPTQPDPLAPVRVDVFLDPSSRWLGPSLEAIAVIAQDKVGVAYSYFVERHGEEAPSADVIALATGAAAAGRLGADRAYLEAVVRLHGTLPAAELPAAAATAAGLDPKAWRAEWEAAAQQIEGEGALRSRVGVRATPTWFVDGYRLAGLQSPAALGGVVGRELEDLRWSPLPSARRAGRTP